MRASACWLRRTCVGAQGQPGQGQGGNHGLAVRAGSGFLFRPGRTTDYAKNLIGSWPRHHPAPAGLPALSAGRLRASWIVELMRARISHDVIATAAGLASAASLSRYQHFVPPLTDEQTLRILRGQAP